MGGDKRGGKWKESKRRGRVTQRESAEVEIQKGVRLGEIRKLNDQLQEDIKDMTTQGGVYQRSVPDKED